MIQIFDSNKPGPNIVVMAGVHGNEKCGIVAFEQVLPTLRITKGKVTFVIGNPEAVALNVRFTQSNLNRMFRGDEGMTEEEKNSYEFERARELMPILKKADALLDIHSSTTAQTIPFIICEQQSYDCAAYLPGEIIVSGIDVLHPTGTDAFVNQSGGKGICIECGNHDDSKSVSIALCAIEIFLSYFKVIEVKKELKKYPQRKVQADWIYKNVGDFKLTRPFAEFERLKEGSVIGIDDGVEVTAPYDGVILFPNDRTEKGKEAFLFGKEVTGI